MSSSHLSSAARSIWIAIPSTCAVSSPPFALAIPSSFLFLKFLLAVKRCVSTLLCTDFKTWKHFTDGSNSHIYKARCAPTAAVPPESRSDAIADNTQAMLKSGAKVIIKALKDTELQNSVALREFDSERELLASISHPNILRFLGSGIDITNSIKSDGLGPPAPTRTNSMKNMLEGRSKIYPKPFLVLERLNGGSLSLLLSLQQGTLLILSEL